MNKVVLQTIAIGNFEKSGQTHDRNFSWALYRSKTLHRSQPTAKIFPVPEQGIKHKTKKFSKRLKAYTTNTASLVHEYKTSTFQIKSQPPTEQYHQ